MFVVIYNIWRYYHKDDSYEYCSDVQDTVDNNQGINQYKAIGVKHN